MVRRGYHDHRKIKRTIYNDLKAYGRCAEERGARRLFVSCRLIRFGAAAFAFEAGFVSDAILGRNTGRNDYGENDNPADDHTIGGRNGDQHSDFCDNAAVFAASGFTHRLWADVPEPPASDVCKVLHIHHEGNASDAAVDGGVFWALLSVWN
jgi:hypothetical protein